MIVLQIVRIKEFMSLLLRTDLFDHFLLSEAVIKGKCSFVIDGHITADFYTADELEELQLSSQSCLPFSMLRENCFSLIKGRKTPPYFKFVFQLSPANLARALANTQSSLHISDLTAVFLNIRFQDGILSCTSGVSYRTFTLEHTFEREWDALICRFFTSQNIYYEEIH